MIRFFFFFFGLLILFIIIIIIIIILNNSFIFYSMRILLCNEGNEQNIKLGLSQAGNECLWHTHHGADGGTDVGLES